MFQALALICLFKGYVGFEVLTAVVMKSTIFCFQRAFTPVSCSAYSSALQMEVIYSSETSADFRRTTQRYIPEGSTLLKGCLKTTNNPIILPRVSFACNSNNLTIRLINTDSMQALLQDSFYFNYIIIEKFIFILTTM
jgi:hypothetical protein